MSLTSIIFSRGRPAQLDLLLRSGYQNAPELFCAASLDDAPWIIARVEDDYYQGYHLLQDEHPGVRMAVENPDQTFQQIVKKILPACEKHVAFFVDDDVIYRPLPIADPAAYLDLFPETLCFSLRLGMNCTQCYPMRAEQGLPFAKAHGSFVSWEWRHADAKHDWRYPGSLDGGIFRRDDLLRWLDDAEYTNPNQLEEALLHGIARTVGLPLMASFKQSVLVGIPVNAVSDTHSSNRQGEAFPTNTRALNDQYLAGRRLSLNTVAVEQVNAAHVEFPLLWEGQ